jgi:rhodanese-related sulfurtransferase
MKKIFLLSAVLFIALLVAGCQSRSVSGEEVSVRGGAYRNITPRELSTMLKSKDFVFINVHIPFAGNIADTDLSIPYDQIEQNLNLLPADKNAKIVLYCRSGHMSKIAAEKLVSLGYTNIWNLEGGMADWEKAGYQIEK